ncbi:hypothetical protein FGE12_08320 [Aggregicoccus sp. 17bor-14]|uniref:hypothetical protein n=1 Tax=Myxococcaceae TaxID=31 RepID=UPI00129D08B0|nr:MULTISPECIES: hypothetical protein [Myxococcaceae]MBF5042402.1 hypothetical protein [Simulacricoccus sp. 17bor-14]MRI88174.1 hypothetical protein [Aggregicoccus sp. 17bor-14]
MAKVVLFVLALAAVLTVAHYGLETRAPAASPEVPTRQLQNVREAASRIETGAQQRADEALQRTASDAPAGQ